MKQTTACHRDANREVNESDREDNAALYGAQSGAGAARLMIGCLVVALVGVGLFKMLSPRHTPEVKSLSQAQSQVPQKTDTAPQEVAAPDAPTSEEQESVGKEETAPEEEVRQFVATWQEAWQNSAGAQGDTEGYMALYGEEFQAKGLDKAGWQNAKAERNRRKAWIQVEVADLAVTALPDGATYQAGFTQNYSSSNYSDTGSKVLTIRKNDEGEWQIIAEQ